MPARDLRALRIVGTDLLKVFIPGKAYEVDVPEAGFKAWMSGTLIQNALPNLTPEQREFLISGMTPDEWNAMFGESPVSDSLVTERTMNPTMGDLLRILGKR